ncbi:MAG TPA: helix-turn-helix domain-containing protein [Caulobacteraceae bacterium]
MRPAPSQDRSRRTAERFLDAALKLLETKTFEELAVADLAREAGRSVGAFYQRFGSKDDFLVLLLVTYFESRELGTAQILAEGRDEGVVEAVLTDNFLSIMRNRNLWHAALRKSAQAPGFWSQFHRYVQRRPQLMAARLGELSGQSLSDGEVYRLGIALQVFNSVINNQMMNNPGPLMLGGPEFLPALLRVFRAVYVADL